MIYSDCCMARIKKDPTLPMTTLADGGTFEYEGRCRQMEIGNMKLGLFMEMIYDPRRSNGHLVARTRRRYTHGT